MSKAVDLVRPLDLDALWARSEPDLELDNGEIRPIRANAPERSGRVVSGVLRAIGAAAPVAAVAVISSIEEISRWD